MATVAVSRRSPHRSARPAFRRQAAGSEIYYIKQIDNSRVVRVADPREKREFLLWLLFGTVLFAAGLTYTLEQFAMVRCGYAIADLKGRRDDLMEANRKLRLEEASLRSPERIDSIAREKLGLQSPQEGQVVRMEEPIPPADGTVVVARMKPYTRAE